MNELAKMGIGAALALTAAQPAAAQDLSPAAEEQAESTIVVSAAGRTYRARGGEFRSAQRAFRRYRDEYAPEAELILQLSSPDVPVEQLRGLDLWLTSDDERIPLPLDERMRFTLPDLQADDWAITTRTRGLRLQVTPWVLSPGSEIGDWRFGDLLLQCRVAVAVMKHSMNFLQSGMFAIAGGCGSRRAAIWQGMPFAIVDAYIAHEDEQMTMERHRFAFRLPGYLAEDVPLDTRARVIPERASDVTE